MANVKNDDVESLEYADEGEYIEADEEGGGIEAEIADMIADTFGRSPIDADYELAKQIIAKLKS